MEPMVDYSLLTNEEEPEQGFVLKRARARSKAGTLTNTVAPGQAVLPSALAAAGVNDYRARAAELFDQGSKLYDAEPDFSQLQAFAKQRGQQGDAAMLNALAAQYAGEGFAPLQDQFLKKAASARDPIKMGSGMLTADGQFLKDPEAAQNKKAEFLMAQAKAYETLAQSAETARERLAAQRQQQEIMNEFKRMGLQIQAANAGAGAENRAFKAADSLRNEYIKRADKVREGTGHAQSVVQMLNDPEIATNPTKQVSLIFSFGKMLDPDSVVRESEYALIANARGLADQLQQIIPQLQTGAKLSPKQLQSMNAVAQTIVNGSSSRIQDLDNYYIDLARRRRVDPQDVLPSYRAGRGGGGASGGGNVIDFSALPKDK